MCRECRSSRRPKKKAGCNKNKLSLVIRRMILTTQSGLRASPVKAGGICLVGSVVIVLARSTCVRLLVVFIIGNGLLCHLTRRVAFVLWDILFNLSTVILVNVTTTWQPGTIISSALGFFFFLISSQHPETFWAEVMHVCLVQWMFTYCLIFWDTPDQNSFFHSVNC